jgi:hypothetical protein
MDDSSCFNKIEKQKHVLLTLARCKKNIRQTILKNADKNLIQTICECCLNFLFNRVKVNETELSALKEYKRTLRKLILKSSLKEKKKVLVQKGGFLQYLIPAVISGLSALFESAIKA